MAEGLEEGDEENHLITYHLIGRQSSSWWFHDAEWLDFNFIQSGHFIHNTSYEIVSEDYGKEPVKPTMDSEPGYENITDRLIRNDRDAVRIGAWDVRRYVYLGVFAGGAGHAYGCGEVYEFWEPGTSGVVGRVTLASVHAAARSRTDEASANPYRIPADADTGARPVPDCW